MSTGTVTGRLVQCAPAGSTPPTQGLPLTLVAVLGQSFTALTDANGSFTFSYLPGGDYTLGPAPLFQFYNGSTTITPLHVVAGGSIDLGDIQTTNLQTDSNNCGSCGLGCQGGAICAGGVCNTQVNACQDGRKDGSETDVDCGGGTCATCALGKQCLANSDCQSGLCTNGACVNPTCPAGQTMCSGTCVDTTSSTTNCGTCGTVCNAPNGSPACSNGVCTIASCGTGFQNCNNNAADGCEVNVNTDVNNCGACGHKCSAPNGISACTNGQCTVIGCSTGFADCNANPSDGCETSTGTDPNNCGTCGNKCNLPNAAPGCSGGSCTVTSCNAGFQDCNHKAGDGCEVNTNTDPNNCGACLRQCVVPNGTPGCSAGSCTIASCFAGWANCNGNPADGCETNVANDPNNCGACFHVCGSGQTCSNFTCVTMDGAGQPALFTPVRGRSEP